MTHNEFKAQWRAIFTPGNPTNPRKATLKKWMKEGRLVGRRYGDDPKRIFRLCLEGHELPGAKVVPAWYFENVQLMVGSEHIAIGSQEPGHCLLFMKPIEIPFPKITFLYQPGTVCSSVFNHGNKVGFFTFERGTAPAFSIGKFTNTQDGHEIDLKNFAWAKDAKAFITSHYEELWWETEAPKYANP